MSDPMQRIFVDGGWRQAHPSDSYRAVDPTTREAFGAAFPVSAWSDVDAALNAVNGIAPASEPDRAALLRAYADAIDASKAELATIAERETTLPARERFANVEIPRTVDQLRQAATSVDRRDWQQPTIDTRRNLRSCLNAIGPVATFGPANFPFAYNAIAGGDFAGAIAAGCALIGRAHPSHPNTTERLMELLVDASTRVGVPCPAQLLFGFDNDDGLRLAGDRRLAAIGFTGSRAGGLALKAAADASGIAFFGELSSVNPVVVTHAALEERCEAIADEYVASVLLAGGQMCTKPGLVFVENGAASRRFIERIVDAFRARPPTVLLNGSIDAALDARVRAVRELGASLRCGGKSAADQIAYENTLFVTTDDAFLCDPAAHRAEMFGPAAILVLCDSLIELDYALQFVDANLTGSIYFADGEAMAETTRTMFASLRRRVGRLLTNAMPTGVAVSAAMNHGGPWPASTSPHFSAVGFPGAIRRFARLDCYDRVHPALLPDVLRDENPTGAVRLVDGRWTDEPIGMT